MILYGKRLKKTLARFVIVENHKILNYQMRIGFMTYVVDNNRKT